MTYWCKERLVITVEGPDGRRVVEVDRPFARVGSHRSSEVVLADETIAPRRLYFHATPTGLFCVDLAPVESAAPPRDGWIHADEYFMVGPYRISAQRAGQAAPPAERLPDLNAKGTVPRPAPVLVMSVKGENVARRELTRQLTVFGRRHPSALRVTSRSVSASHCVFYWESNVLWVVDLLSGNGTRLDGHPIEACRLLPGETIRAGRVDLSLLAPSGVDRGDDGVREITYDDRPGEERIKTDHDDSLDAQCLPTDRGRHEFPQEIAESLALAARLASQREDFDAERAEWDDWRQKTEAELAQRGRELAARQAEFERQKENWESEQQAVHQELDIARQNIKGIRQKLDDKEDQREGESSDQDGYPNASQQRPGDSRTPSIDSPPPQLAPAPSDLDEPPNGPAPLENERRPDSTTLQRQATQQMIRLGPQWSPPIRPADAWLKRPWYATLGWWTAIVVLALILSASIGAACWFALLPAQTVVAAVQTTAEPAPSFESSGLLGENEDELHLVTPREILRASRPLVTVLLRPDVRSLLTIESRADAFDWLRKELVVGSPDASGLTRISLRGKNAEELKILLDAIAEECVSEVTDLQRTQLEQRVKVLEVHRDGHERGVAGKEATLDQLLKEVPSGNAESLPEKQQANLKRLAEARGKLARLRESLAAATREQESIQARLTSPAAVCVIRHAATVQQADRTYRLPITVVAAACGFLVPLLYAAGWSSRRHRARSATRLLREYASTPHGKLLSPGA